MIRGIGIDNSSIDRCMLLKDSVVRRILSDSEMLELEQISNKRVRAEFIASRFAVKEAYSKACGTGFGDKVDPCEVSVIKDSLGCPSVVLSGSTAANAPQGRILVSITHEENIASAIVIIEE